MRNFRLGFSPAVPDRSIVKTVRAVGMVMTFVGLGLLLYQFGHDFVYAVLNDNDGCTVAGASPYLPWSHPVTCSGIRWTHYVPLLAIGVSLWVTAAVALSHYFVKVYDGLVTGLDISSGRYGDSWYVQVTGDTLAGEKRSYWVSISYNTWRKLRDGDRFSWHD